MKKLIKNGFIFGCGTAVGFILCGRAIVKTVIKSDTLRGKLIEAITDKIMQVLHGDKTEERKCQHTHTTVPL